MPGRSSNLLRKTPQKQSNLHRKTPQKQIHIYYETGTGVCVSTDNSWLTFWGSWGVHAKTHSSEGDVIDSPARREKSLTQNNSHILSSRFWAEPSVGIILHTCSFTRQEFPVTSSSIWKKRQKGTKHHMPAINIIARVESPHKKWGWKDLVGFG